jgi:hypothetical protein
MTDNELIKIAENFLMENKIVFAKPVRIGAREASRIEVIFWMPEALIPGCVIVPPDVRVWVYLADGEVEEIYQI